MCVCSWAMQGDLWSSVAPWKHLHLLVARHCTQSFTHIIVSDTSFTHNFITHNSSHTVCLTSRSSTTSFVFPSFPVPLQLLFLIIGRSWLVGLSGPLIFVSIETSLSKSFDMLESVTVAQRSLGLSLSVKRVSDAWVIALRQGGLSATKSTSRASQRKSNAEALRCLSERQKRRPETIC